ncbi:MAG: [protein-PII] uridylyltransferase [Deltaproteobacteria bacterium]|nr:[protein-PII] uridylyltransferase [Deltaproteobacteria bacterium]
MIKDIAAGNENLLALHREKKVLEFHRFKSDLFDNLLGTLFEKVLKSESGKNSSKKKMTLLSLGGYGRQELALHSDIDLLFLYEGMTTNELKKNTEPILYPLWDAGLEVGFATRTLTDCRKIIEEDITALTALIDGRFLAGDRSLYDKLSEIFWKRLKSLAAKKEFWKRKGFETQERLAKYGASLYLLEPNLKEGEGGLRDYHNILWVGRVFEKIKGPDELKSKGWIPEEEEKALKKALHFLWNTRNELHRLSGRKNDQLLLDFQEPIAHWWGFSDKEGILPVEQFMQRYYQEAAIVHEWSARLTRRWAEEPTRLLRLFPFEHSRGLEEQFKVVHGQLSLADSDLFAKDPMAMLRLFEVAQREDLTIDDYTKDKVRGSALRINDDLRREPEAGNIFKRILKEPKRLGATLLLMNELKVLGQFLPEFEKLRFRVQHDVYHVYTVDIHSIFAVDEFSKLYTQDESQFPVAVEALKDIQHQDLLAFAILYHDIGKGEGAGHVEKGVPLIRGAARRLGFSAEEIDLLEFLEKSHLIMPHLAFRRDLEDQNMIIQFAKSFPNLEALSMLYLLTFCDVKAVGPKTMTPWKASLLDTVYLKTREVLVKGAFDKEKVSLLADRAKEEVRKLLTTEEAKEAELFFKTIPTRYLLATKPSEIVRHLALWRQFKKEERPVIDHRHRGGASELTIFCWNTPQLFSKICGVTASNTLNIVEAQSIVTSLGEALCLFMVSDIEGGPIVDEHKWGRVLKDLREVIEGSQSIEKMVQERLRPSLLKPKTARIVPTRIEIDNDISAYYTVIDIYAHDRIGLLYQIISTLSHLGLSIDISKISTKVDQVSDSFYVKDLLGQKVTSLERLAKIKEELTKVMGGVQ